MTNLAKCLKPSGACWSKKEEFVEYSELAMSLKEKLLPARHHVTEYCACGCSSFMADVDACLK